MWWLRRDRAPEEHLEFVVLDHEEVLRRCACPRGHDHERLTSLTLANAVASEIEAAAA
jgi:hypothetical protein